MSAKEFEESLNILKFTSNVRKEIRVSWQPPEVGWVKCYVDGSSGNGGSAAGCGCIIRDSDGAWKADSTLNLGNSDSLSAEISSMILGLDLAWEKGFRRVILESDSRQAIDLIGGGASSEQHPLAELI